MEARVADAGNACGRLSKSTLTHGSDEMIYHVIMMLRDVLYSNVRLLGCTVRASPTRSGDSVECTAPTIIVLRSMGLATYHAK